MDLKITSEKVLEAAKSCPDAKRVLAALFPDAFRPPATDFLLGFRAHHTPDGALIMKQSELIKGYIWLDGRFDWTLERGGPGNVFLSVNYMP